MKELKVFTVRIQIKDSALRWNHFITYSDKEAIDIANRYAKTIGYEIESVEVVESCPVENGLMLPDMETIDELENRRTD